jgi:hypothetical protein
VRRRSAVTGVLPLLGIVSLSGELSAPACLLRVRLWGGGGGGGSRCFGEEKNPLAVAGSELCVVDCPALCGGE